MQSELHLDHKVKSNDLSQMVVAHACNPSYLEGRDQENGGSRPAQEEKKKKKRLSTTGCMCWYTFVISSFAGKHK
jgi:hypothetical protein